MPRAAVSRSFSLRPEEVARFDRLVQEMAGGSPTLFIRQAMDRMEALENWRVFEELREVGVRRARDAGLSDPDAQLDAVRRVLNSDPEHS